MPKRERIQEITLFVADLYNEIETEILVNAAKSLKMSDGLTADGFSTYQAEQLQRLGRLNEENIAILRKYSDRTAEEIEIWIETVGLEYAHELDVELSATMPAKFAAVGPATTSNNIAAIIAAYGDQAKDAFNLTNTSMLREAQSMQMDILNKVTARVITGQMTPQKALTEVVRQATEKGIALPLPESKTGQKWQLEGYVNMITRSTTGNVAEEMQNARFDEFEVDLVEVSSHAGARPKCAPYQGRIYSRSGNSKLYPALSSTSYGQPDGLRGINCGHVFYAFVHGKSTKTFEPYDKEENDRIYKESQQQRKLEREIRKAKKELAVMEGLDDPAAVEAAKEKVKESQKKMRGFIDESGRTRRYKREKIVSNADGTPLSAPPKGTPPAGKAKAPKPQAPAPVKPKPAGRMTKAELQDEARALAVEYYKTGAIDLGGTDPEQAVNLLMQQDRSKTSLEKDVRALRRRLGR